MSTPYVEELALISNNNEGIEEIFQLTAEVNGIEQPIDLTGYTFFAQARISKLPTSTLICEIGVEIYGDPADGRLKFTVDEEVMRAVNPVRGHYDLLARSGPTGIVDSLYMAPFRVGGGVTDVSQWV